MSVSSSSVVTVFRQFFLLGWISFGGPAAHIGYFRQRFVEQLKWLNDEEYAQLVALSQFLPGPGSSQVGFAVGYRQGGLSGAIAAFIGFTLPSMLLMILLATLSSQLTDSGWFEAAVHGLKLLAVVVVADATLGMFGNFCKQKLTITLCIATAMALLILPGIGTQLLALVLAALVGLRWLTGEQPAAGSGTAQLSWLPLLLFAALFLLLPLIAGVTPLLQLFSDLFQAGSLVFGGGHVVLPLLQGLVGDQMSADSFLTGYAAAQAVPGPMFTLATWLGYNLTPTTPIAGALIATLAIFLPGFLLLLAVLKNWQTLAAQPHLAGAIKGINAAVPGLLLAALYQPVFTSAVINAVDMALVIAGFALLRVAKLPIIALVALFILSGVATTVIQS